jgi:hypothetical protein
MNKSHQQSGRSVSRQFWRAVGLLAGCGLLSGCSLLGRPPAADAGNYAPENFYASNPFLPPEIKRVAVLPLVTESRTTEWLEGCVTLDTVLNAELAKTKRFEVIQVTPETLNRLTGRVDWKAEETLPPELFTALRERSGCDAVLFCQLTEFRAYAPQIVGLRLKLVDARTRQILWAGDEICDARTDTTPDSRKRAAQLSRESWMMQTSPRSFGEYAVAGLLATLPAR